MKTFKESAMRVRQGDVKPTAKIMATQHIERGNMKKTLDLLKHIGKKVKIDKSSQKTSKAIWTIEGRMIDEKGKGLWHNIRAKRKRGEPKAKPGDKDYPKTLDIESVELDENKLKDGDKVKTPQGTVEIKARDTSAMRGKQDKFTMVLHMKNGKKASMGSHPAPTASAVTNIAKRWDKGVPSYMAHLKAESVEEKRDASKSATGYDIYHKTYSGALQHAYAHAKKKHGVTVRSDEIDSKVASGPSKPSTGKTTSHILGTDKKKNLHVQVYNTGKSYELNMYVESVELDEGALGKQWVNGAKRVKSGSITLVKAKNPDADLHTVMKNGKKVGTFVFDDGPDAFSVTNMSTKKVSWADQIDDIPKMFESVELDEAIDFFKVSKELSDYAKKNGGPDKREFEKAAAYVREIGKNSAVSVQDKAGKGLNMLFKNADTDVRDRMQMILKKGGFKVQGGYVMRESTAAYGKSLSDIRNKRKMAAIKPKDRETLKKLSDLMKKANEDSVEEGKWFVRQSAKPNKTGTYQGKKYDDGKKAIAQARKDWKLTPDEHMSAKMMKEAIEEGLDARQIALLKKNYSTIDRIDPSGPAYKKAVGMISGLDKDMQMDLAKAKIKFLSQIAADQLRKQHKIKLKAKDYMESLTFSELVNNG